MALGGGHPGALEVDTAIGKMPLLVCPFWLLPDTQDLSFLAFLSMNVLILLDSLYFRSPKS